LEDRLQATDANEATPPADPTPAVATSSSCEKCGASLSAGQEHCHSCYYHSGLKRVVDTRDESEQDGSGQTFGFRNYLQEKLSKGQSPESVFYLLDFFFCLLLLAITLWFSLRIYFALLPIGLYVTYRVIVQAAGHANRGASLLWLIVLFFGRGLEWKTFGGTPRIACTRRGAAFDDSDLAGLGNLSELQVLDLAGTAVTDAGLIVLHQQASLAFIVLRKTSVTKEGVWKLQQTIPATCIWY